ncbi:MAG: prepilin-type N-terminal cleavage/methylation domain-containing protein [Candidatus Riflebacteria bacterium]|nr:prepilin-type N-terminal cleavage/methylation domain-containing protein [Candidatus Riflebacteria bacterium]
MTTRRGMTLVEIMLAVLIMAFALIPIAGFLSGSAKGTKSDKSEAEAMQFACDIMDTILMKVDFTSPDLANNVPSIASSADVNLPQTQVKYTIEVLDVQIPDSATTNFAVPKLDYHDPCANGVEINTDLATKISTDTSRSLFQVDKEKLTSATDIDLKDIRLKVRWKPRGSDDKEYDVHPIILYTRKARL